MKGKGKLPGGARAADALCAALLAAALAAAVLPLALGVLLSLSGGGAGYQAIFQPGSLFLRAYGNNLWLCCCILPLQLGIGVLSGWGLARYRFFGRGVVLTGCALLMLLPAQALLLPQYLLLRALGLLDNLWGILLLRAFSPLGTMLFWAGFSGLPRPMLDAAALEGAGPLDTLWRIALPLCKRELAAFLLLGLAEEWSILEQPMAFLRSPARYPLSLYLAFSSTAGPRQLLAGCVAALLPPAAGFWLLGRVLHRSQKGYARRAGPYT